MNTPDDSATIADHKDINNKDQTISYKPITPTPHETKVSIEVYFKASISTSDIIRIVYGQQH